MLEELYLANNYDEMVEGSGLTGPVPTWLNGNTGMRELWIWGNRLSGTIPDLSGMASLRKLKLGKNDLTGGIPEWLGSMSNLQYLIIDTNHLDGTIPDLSGMTSLTHLWLHGNELTGSIPDLSSLDELTRLRLQDNMLTGEVPATLGDLDSLQYLWLHGNELTGGIPDALGNLADTLAHISLKDNNFDDDACVPAALANVATNDYEEAGLEVCESDDGS